MPAASFAGQIVFMHGGSSQSLWVMNDNGTDQRPLITNQDGISSPSQPSLARGSTNLAFQASAPALPTLTGPEGCGYNCVGIYSLLGGKIRRVSPPVVSCAGDTENCSTKVDNDPSMTADGHVVYLHAGSLLGLPLCSSYGCTTWGASSVVFLEQSDVGGDTPKQWLTPSDTTFAGNYQPQNYPGSNPVADPGNANLIAYSGLQDYNCQGPDSCDPLTIDNSAGTSAYNVTDADCDFGSGGCGASNDMNVLAFSAGGKYVLVDISSPSLAQGVWIFRNQQYAYSGGFEGSTSPIYGTGWWVWEPGPGDTIGQGGAITSDTPGQGQIIFTFDGNIVSIPGSCWGGTPTFTTGQPVPPTIAPTCHSGGTNLTSGGSDTYPTWTSSTASFFPTPTNPATTTVGKIGVTGTTVSFSLRCSAGTSNCADILGLATSETLHGSKVTAVAAAKTKHKSVVVGSTRVTLTAGAAKTVKLGLNGTGRKLLSKFPKLPMLAVVLQGGKTVGAHKVTVTAPKRKHHHH
jgi:hypothetical protein